METVDPAAEFLRISERYRRMSDGEILVLAGQSSELTDVARQALASEISHRGLKVQTENPPAPPSPEPPASSGPADSSYSEERELVDLCTVWSLPDALQVQTLLDRAGIPFFMGPEKATGVDAVTSNFANGVSVKVMQIGMPWASQAMQNYTPANEPGPKYHEVLNELPVRCPKCHSAEVIFEGLITEPTSAAENPSRHYQWTCDSCGHHWEDDGTAEEA
jgi:DNA-directed RNA polymerase subunit M/transcription elongation factor TFIIS